MNVGVELWPTQAKARWADLDSGKIGRGRSGETFGQAHRESDLNACIQADDDADGPTVMAGGDNEAALAQRLHLSIAPSTFRPVETPRSVMAAGSHGMRIGRTLVKTTSADAP
jgi:hypothetical protein